MLLEQEIDRKLEIMLGAKDVGPHARYKLRNLLKYYAKKPKPFTACVRDNRKRFGPRTEAVCATLKDIIRGTTKWRKGGKKKAHLSDDDFDYEGPEFDDEVAELLESLTEQEIMEIVYDE